jgi:ADP-L-glycero-D-manno-heptose 6-epimerase
VATINACRKLDGDGALTISQMLELGLISYTPFPDALKGKYQSFTQADIGALRSAGYTAEFATVEAAVAQYIPWLASHL